MFLTATVFLQIVEAASVPVIPRHPRALCNDLARRFFRSINAPAVPLDVRWIVLQTSYLGNFFKASAMSLSNGAP